MPEGRFRKRRRACKSAAGVLVEIAVGKAGQKKRGGRGVGQLDLMHKAERPTGLACRRRRYTSELAATAECILEAGTALKRAAIAKQAKVKATVRVLWARGARSEERGAKSAERTAASQRRGGALRKDFSRTCSVNQKKPYKIHKSRNKG